MNTNVLVAIITEKEGIGANIIARPGSCDHISSSSFAADTARTLVANDPAGTMPGRRWFRRASNRCVGTPNGMRSHGKDAGLRRQHRG